ncbi:MAG TPA: DUF3900 domain-containing protein [Bacillota bacterium]|nr:DUF3900 domain-containing protein [Bacillota bacterium]
MEFKVEYLSFYVIKGESLGESVKSFRHYQTLDEVGYEQNNLKWFLDGEFSRTVKRKVDVMPKTMNAPTKIGRFIVEAGFGLDSNPNYNLFARLRQASDLSAFQKESYELVNSFVETTSIRGGAMIIARAKLIKYFDEPFLFIMKCDFESKVASIADERNLIQEVEMAIHAKNIKSIQYPHMPEEGMVSEWELKIHQSSHSRYFEDFLKFVTYEPSVPEMMNDQMLGMVQNYLEESYPENLPEREKESEEIEIWAHKKERELNEKWTHDQVVDATQYLVEQKPDLELKLKLDGVAVKGLLSQYGENIHLAKLGDRYVVLIEGESFQFENGISPIELLRPSQLEEVIQKIGRAQMIREVAAASEEPPF